MSQRKRHSALESFINTVVGFVLALVLQFFLMRWMGIQTTSSQNFVVVGSFTILSFTRSYVLRRLFNKINE